MPQNIFWNQIPQFDRREKTILVFDRISNPKYKNLDISSGNTGIATSLRQFQFSPQMFNKNDLHVAESQHYFQHVKTFATILLESNRRPNHTCLWKMGCNSLIVCSCERFVFTFSLKKIVSYFVRACDLFELCFRFFTFILCNKQRPKKSLPVVKNDNLNPPPPPHSDLLTDSIWWTYHNPNVENKPYRVYVLNDGDMSYCLQNSWNRWKTSLLLFPTCLISRDIAL